jgi:hypothetical protein
LELHGGAELVKVAAEKAPIAAGKPVERVVEDKGKKGKKGGKAAAEKEEAEEAPEAAEEE